MDSQILQSKNVPILGRYVPLEGKYVIGKKQTLRFLTRDEVSKVFISKDADIHVTKEIIDICKDKNIEIIYFDNMRDLGKACNIDVNAAAAAVLK